MKKIFLSSLFLLSFGLILAQSNTITSYTDPNGAEREHNVDITNMKVEVSFDVHDANGGKVFGKVTHSFTPIQKKVDTLFFDGPGINIKSAELDGKKVEYKVRDNGVTVYFTPALTWDKSHNIVFEYETNPRKGLYFIGWNQPEQKGNPDFYRVRKQIWSQGQGIDNRHWIPMYDNMNDKFTTETVVTFNSDYKVLSNGKLVSKKANKKDGTTTWNYKMDKPHAGYLLMIAIGDYDIKSTKTSRGTPVHFWYYPEFKDKVEPTSKYTEEIIEFLEDETGVPYPWTPSYSQIMVQDFLYGAMENTTATIFGDFFSTNEREFEDRNYINVNAHELTHMWFGDMITARSGNDAWLQESFATYYAKQFKITLPEYGKDEVKYSQLNEYNSAFGATKIDNFPIRHTKGGSARIYPKGSAVLQMLRYVVGDEEFKRTIKYYLNEHSFRNVDAYDFMNAFKDELGMNLDWFFEQWVLRGGEPHYKVNYNSLKNSTLITVEQIHDPYMSTEAFKMPIQFAVYYKDGSVDRQSVMVDKKFQQVSIDNPKSKQVSFVVFDENSEIMKLMTFERSFEELSEQALKAVNMADRLEAILALDEVENPNKNEVLEKIINKDGEFYAVKSEAWRQWLKNNQKSNSLPNVDLKKEHRNVRLAVANGLNANQPAQRSLLENLLTDNSLNTIEAALDNLFSSTDISPAFEWLKKVENLDGFNKSIRIKYLEYSILNTTNENTKQSLLKELTEYGSANYEFRTRVAAFESLGRLNYADETVFANMFEAMSRYNSRLANPTKTVFKNFESQSSLKPIIRKVLNEQSDYIKKYLKERGID